ncbi:hypothetical protein [Polaromonas sp. SM01]|uniref:hypothetical protein n=1 Tax=Polaromonas sp. SM01 TaxID=3085630 RepID=UPI002980B069|nr:hypothetical protein [Polaromonas sp. SM01]MDW5444305.1 hypothetical protein [Polaromonas sp. SM01]
MSFSWKRGGRGLKMKWPDHYAEWPGIVLAMQRSATMNDTMFFRNLYLSRLNGPTQVPLEAAFMADGAAEVQNAGMPPHSGFTLRRAPLTTRTHVKPP